MEVVVLRRLQNVTTHVCTFLGCGRTEKINYMVMSLLGPSLSELRKQHEKQRFSLSTTLRVGIQVLSAVQSLHDCGFLHRDIKPSNFAIGSSSATKRICFMLDFGLARQYTNPTGEIRPPRPVAGFRGTVRYASINAHLSKELGRHDDLWSVFYMLVELATGELPWKKIRDKEEAGKCKRNYDHKKLVKLLPIEFSEFHNHLNSLHYYQKPEYQHFADLLKKAMTHIGANQADLFDWEQDLSIPSVTSGSMGSAPAIRSNNERLRGCRREVGGKEEEEGEGASGTECSEERSYLNQNEERAQAQGGQIQGTKFAPLLQAPQQHTSNTVPLMQRNPSLPSPPLVVTVKEEEDEETRESRNSSTSSTSSREGEKVMRGVVSPPSPLLLLTPLHLNHYSSSPSVHQESLDKFFNNRSAQESLLNLKHGDQRSKKGVAAYSSCNGQTNRKREEGGWVRGGNPGEVCLTEEGERKETSPTIKIPMLDLKCESNGFGFPRSGTNWAGMVGQQTHPLRKVAKKESVVSPSTSPSSSPSSSSVSPGPCGGSVSSQHDSPCPEVYPDIPPLPRTGYLATSLSLEAAVDEVANKGDKKIEEEGRERGTCGLKSYIAMETNSAESHWTQNMTGSGERQGEGVKYEDGGQEEEEEGEKEKEKGSESKMLLLNTLVVMRRAANRKKGEINALTHAPFLNIRTVEKGVHQTEPAEKSPERDRFSPGPLPLDFTRDRPLKMWGQDSTKPHPLSQCLGGLGGKREGAHTHSSRPPLPSLLLTPHPPSHPPPPKNAAMVVRRKRFRRPVKLESSTSL